MVWSYYHTSLNSTVIHIWAVTWDFQQCDMCDQQRLRPACAYPQSDHRAFASRLNILWLLSYWSYSIWMLHRLVWVYTCQNATLLEITCHGSYLYINSHSSLNTYTVYTVSSTLVSLSNQIFKQVCKTHGKYFLHSKQTVVYIFYNQYCYTIYMRDSVWSIC